MANRESQATTGNLYGTVTDEVGAPLPGVFLSLTGTESQRTQVSNAEGEFRFMGVPPGTYQLTAELDGFNSVKRTDIEIHAGRDTPIKIVMSLANVDE